MNNVLKHTLWIPLSENNRRTTQRLPLHARVSLVAPVHAEGVTLNASSGGARIAVNTALYPGDRVVLHMTFDSGVQRELSGRVVWTRPASDGTIAGVQYAALQHA